jgi:hypothetical protein
VLFDHGLPRTKSSKYTESHDALEQFRAFSRASRATFPHADSIACIRKDRPVKKIALYVSLLVALLSLTGFASVAHAASDLSHTPKQPSFYATYNDTASFFDPNYNSWFAIVGTLGINVAYIHNPPYIDDQYMYAAIPNGGYYDQSPSSTYDTVNDKNGSLIGTYFITDRGCIAPGFPNEFLCGHNWSYVAPPNLNNCPPVTVYHHWVAVDGGTIVGAGSWRHPMNLC